MHNKQHINVTREQTKMKVLSVITESIHFCLLSCRRTGTNKTVTNVNSNKAKQSIPNQNNNKITT